MNNKTSLVGLGTIGKPHGLSGEVHYSPYNLKTSLPVIDMIVWLGKDIQTIRKEIVEIAKLNSNSPLLKFRGITSREQAGTLHSLLLFVSRNQLPETDNSSYYLTDLVLCHVFDSENNLIGIVEDVLSLPANDVLVVNQNDEEYLIPLIDDVVKLIDIHKGRIIIEVLDGLLD